MNGKFLYDDVRPILHCNRTFFRSTIMTTATLNSYTERGYLGNLAKAAKTFLRALFAVAPVTASVSHGMASQRSIVRDRDSLWKLARDFDTLSPSQAAELRNIAGRD
jgi:hypothetical protein